MNNDQWEQTARDYPLFRARVWPHHFTVNISLEREDWALLMIAIIFEGKEPDQLVSIALRQYLDILKESHDYKMALSLVKGHQRDIAALRDQNTTQRVEMDPRD